MIITNYENIAISCYNQKLKTNGNHKVVFTNGCFDLFHYGHLYLLKEAKKLGDILVVGLNSDKSIKKIKNPSRPIINERQRAEILQAIDIVDHVVIFDEKVPKKLIAVINPDYIIKGEEYTEDELNEMIELLDKKCEIITIEKIPDISTSSLIKGIKQCI